MRSFRRWPWRRAFGIACGLVIAGWVVLPALAVPISAVADRSPLGGSRLTAFHLALALSDDSVLEPIRNSLIVATGVTALAMGLGITLGRMSARGRSTRLGAASTLCRASGAYPPLIAAVGMIGVGRFLPPEHQTAWRWIAMGWVELAWAVPRVMAATSAAFSAIDPSLIDAARMGGARKGRARGVVGWPLARGHVARASARVFAWTLFEPGAPLILGLRRTLPVALLEAALDLDREARAAVLACFGIALAFAARAALVAWGGPSRTIPATGAGEKSSRGAPTLATLTLGAWAAVALMPMVGLGASALGLDRSGRFSLVGLRSLWSDVEAFGGLAHGLALGVGALSVAMLVAWGLGPPRRGNSWRDPASWPATLPPLVLGLGVFLMPAQLDALAALFAARPSGIATVIRAVGDLFDPFRSPWLVLVAATATLRVPALREAIGRAGSRDDRDQIDVARTLGASPWRAWATASAAPVAAILASALAGSISRSAIDAAPALILSRTMDARPVAKVIADFAYESGSGTRAAALAFAALIFPVAAWVVGGLGRSSPIRLAEGRDPSLC